MIRMRLFYAFVCVILLAVGKASAQLPADAVDLAKVKIPEKFKATEAENAPGEAGEKAKFDRYVRNYIEAMSKIWCPVTDEITPGGLIQWTVEGITWESCCAFCDESVSDEDFPKALDRLKERAKKSYELTGGKYTEGASSPIEGAMREVADAKGKPADAKSVPVDEPGWLKGKTLQPTYSGGIGLVMDHRCLDCHKPGSAAPMSFLTYPEIKKWTKSMKASVTKHEMPPWPADAGVGSFANSRALTPKEMDLFVKWAEAGFPQGEGTFTATPPPDYTEDKPDALPAGVSSACATNKDFVIPAGAEKFEAKATHEFAEDVKVVSIMPVMNQRGKSIAVSAVLPDGTRKELLKISQWNPDWKFRYVLAEPLAAPKGTKIEAVAVYDNSKLNVRNPNAAAEVKAGADGELLEAWIGYTK